jgi:AraC-like DNA-binding protein/CheY-like chemotaxis protein
MVTSEQTNKARRELVTAGHHILIDVLPLREPESQDALAAFIAAIERIDIPAPDLDAVLLRCLAVLSRHAERIPTLVEQYLSKTLTLVNCGARFSECVQDVLRYHCIRSGLVQEALRFVHARYAEPACTPQGIALNLGVRLATLDIAIRRATESTLTEHIRRVRLDEAAMLLATTHRSIKEVWAEVGYNHHSNFDHDFKRRFHCTPREYRSRAIRPVRPTLYGYRAVGQTGTARPNLTIRRSVMIVDDDEHSRTAVGAYLRRERFRVVLADSPSADVLEIERSAPDVLLVGYPLGKIDSVEFVRLIRQRRGGERPAIVFFTTDWDVLSQTERIPGLNAIVTSKLCDLGQIGDLVRSLSSDANSPMRSESRFCSAVSDALTSSGLRHRPGEPVQSAKELKNEPILDY